MKLLRYGPPGEERPGLLNGTGQLRSLAGVIDDIAGGPDDLLCGMASVNPSRCICAVCSRSSTSASQA